MIKNIYIIGHSQGGRVSATLKEKNIKKIAILSINLYGRFQEEAIVSRFDDILHNTEKKRPLEEIYLSYQDLKGKREIGDDDNTLSNISYKSFIIEPTIKFIEKKEIPILLVYGGKDVGVSFSNDLARFELIDKKMMNIQFKVYDNLNHNFEESDGKVTNSHWSDVLDYVINWMKK